MGSVNIKATVSPLIAAGARSPVQVDSPSVLRGQLGGRYLGSILSTQIASDIELLASEVNTLTAKAKVAPQISQILLTNEQGQVVAAFGPVIFKGVQYVNYLSEVHVGNPLRTRNPSQALFNANLDGSVTIGQNGWLDVHDPWAGNAAWIGTQFETLPVVGAYNNGSGLIRLQVKDHTLATGNTCEVRNMQFAGVPNATGRWTITVIDDNTVDLQGSVWAGSFSVPVSPGGINTDTPTIDRVLQVAAADSDGGLIRLGFSVATGYESGTAVSVGNVGGVPNASGQWIISVPDTLAITGAADNGSGLIRLTVPGQNFQTGDKPEVQDVGGVPNANGYWNVTVIDATHIDLQGSFFDGAYTSGGTISFLNANVLTLDENAQTGAPSVFAGAYNGGGTCLQYFAGILAQTIAIGLSFQDYKLRAFPSGDLRIRNANIELTSSTGQIILNPNTTQIILKNFDNLSEIVLDATIPALTFSDQVGSDIVFLGIQQESPITITDATNASPTVIDAPGNTYVDGDTVLIQGATSNTIINGYRIVESRDAITGKFQITDLDGNVIDATGAYAGTATASRYYAGLLAQTLALGKSFSDYRLRFFADGTLRITEAIISDSAITSTFGTSPNVLTLTINDALLTITGIGTEAGQGNITIDGIMQSSELLLTEKAAPALSGAGQTTIYMDSTSHTPLASINGGAYAPFGGATVPGGAPGSVQYNNASAFGGFGNWNGAVLTIAALAVSTSGILVSAGGLAVNGGALLVPVTFAALPGTPATGTLAVVSDSTVNAWGAVIAGGAGNLVLAFWNGVAWTVAAK